MASSIGGVPPRPLTSSATRSPGPTPRSVGDRGDQPLDHVVGRCAARRAPRPGSPWMPRPSSTSSAPSRKPGCPAAGHGAGAQRHAHRADRLGARCARPADLGQRQRRPRPPRRRPCAPAPSRPGPAGRRRPRRPARRRRRPPRCHVDALGPGQLGGQAEVEPVAGVVLDDQQDAARGGDGPDRVEHGVDRRRGEDLAGDRAGQHPGADVAGVGGLVPGAAAGEQRDLPGRADRLDVAADGGGRAGQSGDAGGGERRARPGPRRRHRPAALMSFFTADHSPPPRADRPGKIGVVHSTSSERRRDEPPPVCASTCLQPAGRSRRRCRTGHRSTRLRRTVDDGSPMNLEALLSARLAPAFAQVAQATVDPVVRRSRHADFQSGAALPLAGPLGRSPRDIAAGVLGRGRPGRGRHRRGLRARLPQPAADRRGARRRAARPRRRSPARRAAHAAPGAGGRRLLVAERRQGAAVGHLRVDRHRRRRGPAAGVAGPRRRAGQPPRRLGHAVRHAHRAPGATGRTPPRSPT